MDVVLDLDVQSHTGFYLIDTLITGNFAAFRNAIAHLILPAITLGTIPISDYRPDDAIQPPRSAKPTLHYDRLRERLATLESYQQTRNEK